MNARTQQRPKFRSTSPARMVYSKATPSQGLATRSHSGLDSRKLFRLLGGKKGFRRYNQQDQQIGKGRCNSSFERKIGTEYGLQKTSYFFSQIGQTHKKQSLSCEYDKSLPVVSNMTPKINQYLKLILRQKPDTTPCRARQSPHAKLSCRDQKASINQVVSLFPNSLAPCTRHQSLFLERMKIVQRAKKNSPAQSQPLEMWGYDG